MLTNLRGPAVGYTDLLDQHVIAKQLKEVEENTRKYNPLRPSSSGKCSRELAYEFMEYRGKAQYPKVPLDPKTVRIFSLGHSVEWNILKQFEELEAFKVKYKQQGLSFFKITEDEWIEGSIDAVFWSEKHKCVIDIKSKGDKPSAWMKTQWDEHTEKYAGLPSVQRLSDTAFFIADLPAFLDEVNDPFLAANFYQLNLYAFSSFLAERGVDHAAVIQYNKNDSRLRELRFIPSREVYDRVEAKFKAVQQAVDIHSDPTLVPKDFVIGNIKCAFCTFNSVCWPGRDGLKEYFESWPKRDWPIDTSRMQGDVSAQLESLYNSYLHSNVQGKQADIIELEICKLLDGNKIRKVRFSDGSIYELRALKGPPAKLVIRRAKL